MIYDIATEPCNEQYCSFVDYAITHSDAVMLVFSIKKGSKLQGDVMKTTCTMANQVKTRCSMAGYNNV